MGLLERGVRSVCLLEAERVAHGASGRNGGFVFGGYSLGEARLVEQVGPAAARRMYARTVAAIELIRRRIVRHAIACDPVEEGVIWANWFRDPAVLEARRRVLQEAYGVHWEPIAPQTLYGMVASRRYTGGLWERNAFHMHPLNYALGLTEAIAAAGGKVFEQSPALALEPVNGAWRVRTPGGSVLAQHVVLACGGYLAGIHPGIDRSIMPVATYVMVTEPLGERLQGIFPGTRAAVYDTRFAFDYYRPLADSRLLWGGRISIRDRSSAQVASLLKKDLLKVFPQLEGVRIEHSWSGLMGYPRHEMPQIGPLQAGLWCLQGFGGHGVATTTAGGEVMASAIAEGGREYLDYQKYGLQPTYKPLGLYATQGWYAWLQWKDLWREVRERLAGRASQEQT